MFSQYAVKIIGQNPCLMHNDNLSWSEQLKKWQIDPDNQAESVKGDDRSPAWTWVGSLYVEGGKVVVPADNCMTMLREGGSRVPTGKRGGTYKKQTCSGLVVDQSSWPLVGPKGEISVAPIMELVNRHEKDFSKYEQLALDLGFSLFVKRARIGQAKHVRVRPRFDVWSAQGTCTVLDETITDKVFEAIWREAGERSGFGDWRPSSPQRPGPFGKFKCEITKIK